MNRLEIQSLIRQFLKFQEKENTSVKGITQEELIEKFLSKPCKENNSEPVTKVQKFQTIAEELSELYRRKNNDYGDSFGQTFSKLGIISAVTRISDKYNRLVSLSTGKEQLVKEEKIEDTLRDMASYAIMTLIELSENGKD